MLRGKDAVCLLGLLSVGLACNGCVGDSPLRGARAERLARRQQPVTTGVAAVPPPPVPASDAGKLPELTQVSVQAPDPPPSSQPPVPGPSLMPEAPPLAPAVNAATSLRQLHRLAAERYAAIDSYIVRLRRREQVNGKDGPEEVLLFKFRKEPWSVYFKWLGQEGAGREVIYVKGQHENKIHTLLAAGDMPLMPAGRRIALAPDSLVVRSASRHSITEAGIGDVIDRLAGQIAAYERSDRRAPTLTLLGAQRRAEFSSPLDAVQLALPPGYEAQLPRGGRRWIFFDQRERLPVLVITQDERGHEVEYYCYDRLQYPVKLDDDDFNPDKLWAKPKTASDRPQRP